MVRRLYLEYSSSRKSQSGSFIYNVGNSTFTSLGNLFVGNPSQAKLHAWGRQSGVINDSGAVVGCIVNTSNSVGYDAAMWKNGTITDLNTLYAPSLAGTGFTLDNATAIDNNGDIAGYGHDATHTVQAFSFGPFCPATRTRTARWISTT